MLAESDDSDSTDSSEEFADAKANDDLSFKSAFDRDSSFDSDTSTSTNLDIDSSTPLSAYHTELIDRITVQCKSLRLLAGLGDKLEDDDIPFQDLVTLIGTASMNPIKDGNEVYIDQDNSEIDTKDAPATPHHPAHHDNALSTTKWTELTNKDGEGVELEIVIDWHPHKRIQLPCHSRAGDTGIGHQTQVLTAAIVVHSQHTELARCAKRVRYKSKDQRSPGRKATGIGVRDPRARLRPLRRRTPSFSSVYSRYSFL